MRQKFWGCVVAGVVAISVGGVIAPATPASASVGFAKNVAINPAGTFAYITNWISNTVSKIDLATDTVVATIPVGQAVGVAINPAGTFAYVTSPGIWISNGKVSKISLATDTVVATISFNGSPTGVAINPAGTFAYITNERSGTVSKISLSTDTVVATIPVGKGTEGVAINPAGTFAYITNYSDATVSKISLATDTVVATIPVGKKPAGVAINPAGTFAYITNYSDATVSKISLATDTVIATIPVGNGTWGVAINPAGTFAYITNFWDAALSKISLAVSNSNLHSGSLRSTCIIHENDDLKLRALSAVRVKNNNLKVSFMALPKDRELGIVRYEVYALHSETKAKPKEGDRKLVLGSDCPGENWDGFEWNMYKKESVASCGSPRIPCNEWFVQRTIKNIRDEANGVAVIGYDLQGTRAYFRYMAFRERTGSWFKYAVCHLTVSGSVAAEFFLLSSKTALSVIGTGNRSADVGSLVLSGVAISLNVDPNTGKVFATEVYLNKAQDEWLTEGALDAITNSSERRVVVPFSDGKKFSPKIVNGKLISFAVQTLITLDSVFKYVKWYGSIPKSLNDGKKLCENFK